MSAQVDPYLAIPSAEKEQSPPGADSQLQSMQEMDKADSGIYTKKSYTYSCKLYSH